MLITDVHWTKHPRHHTIDAVAYDTDEFRAAYRAEIHRSYSAIMHAVFVFGFGCLSIWFFCRRLEHVQPIEWLAVPAAFVFFNWAEYTVHRSFGHKKRRLAELFYRRHTGDHHRFFESARMSYEQARDFRVILFPPWLIVVYTFGLAAPACFGLALVDRNVGALVAITLVAGYLTYELLHATQHLPDSNPVVRLPWVRHMRALHRIHHRHSLMQTKNFNLVIPLMDVLYGTLQWPGEDER